MSDYELNLSLSGPGLSLQFTVIEGDPETLRIAVANFVDSVLDRRDYKMIKLGGDIDGVGSIDVVSPAIGLDTPPEPDWDWVMKRFPWTGVIKPAEAQKANITWVAHAGMADGVYDVAGARPDSLAIFHNGALLSVNRQAVAVIEALP